MVGRQKGAGNLEVQCGEEFDDGICGGERGCVCVGRGGHTGREHMYPGKKKNSMRVRIGRRRNQG